MHRGTAFKTTSKHASLRTVHNFQKDAKTAKLLILYVAWVTTLNKSPPITWRETYSPKRLTPMSPHFSLCTWWPKTYDCGLGDTFWHDDTFVCLYAQWRDPFKTTIFHDSALRGYVRDDSILDTGKERKAKLEFWRSYCFGAEFHTTNVDPHKFNCTYNTIITASGAGSRKSASKSSTLLPYALFGN